MSKPDTQAPERYILRPDLENAQSCSDLLVCAYCNRPKDVGHLTSCPTLKKF